MGSRTINIKQSDDIVLARRAARDTAKELGFGSADQTRLATAVSEISRNVIQYAGAGVCIISDDSNSKEIRIKVLVEDRGQGISDIDKAMEDGFSTSDGQGAGMPGAKRLVSEFDVQSEPGNTKIRLLMKRKRI